MTRACLRYAREGQNVTQAGPKCHTSRAKMSHKGQNVTQSCYNLFPVRCVQSSIENVTSVDGKRESCLKQIVFVLNIILAFHQQIRKCCQESLEEICYRKALDFCFQVSVFMMSAITADRMVAILFPMKTGQFRLRHARYVAGAGWLVCFFLSILPTMGLDYFGDSFFGRTGPSSENDVCMHTRQ